jgi:hypothetical protein
MTLPNAAPDAYTILSDVVPKATFFTFQLHMNEIINAHKNTPK